MSILLFSVQVWSSAWARVPHTLLHLSHKPLFPGTAALLHWQQLRGPSLLSDNQGEASYAPGLVDHPRRRRSWTPAQQGGHRGPQCGSQAEAGLQAAFKLCGSDDGTCVAGEAVWAVQHQNGEGMSGSNGLLHDGDGFDTSRDSTPQPWREGPGAVFRGYPYWVGTENSVQTYRVSAAAAERHGETLHLIEPNKPFVHFLLSPGNLSQYSDICLLINNEQ